MEHRLRRVLGIDPGSERTGFALAHFQGSRIHDLQGGTWTLSSTQSRALKLGELSSLAETWLQDRPVDEAVVESLFHHKNSRSALVLSEARGALLAVLGRLRIPVFEYSPATVKKAICGFGTATKEQVRRALVLTVPGLREFNIDSVGPDATDALALVVAHQAISFWPGNRMKGER